MHLNFHVRIGELNSASDLQPGSVPLLAADTLGMRQIMTSVSEP